MAAEKQIFGRLDCPACGLKDGVRVTHDKNGEPFGYCDANCNMQLRFGGNPRRVALFVARYPWAAGEAKAAAVPVAAPAAASAPAPVAKEKKRSSLNDALAIFGV